MSIPFLTRRNNEQEDQVQEIIRELEELKIAQTRSNQVIERLEQKITVLERNNSVPGRVIGESKVMLEQFKRLVGRRVRLVNSHRGKPVVGVITGVGKLYVTVKLSDDLSRNRQAKNLRLLYYEE